MKVCLWLVVGCSIVQFLTCARGSAVGNFTVEGDLVLPMTGDYTNIPDGSCVRIVVQDNIMCSWPGCTVPERGRVVMRNLVNVVENKIPYKMKCNGGSGLYTISVTLNVGWCREDATNGEWIRSGDYFNEASTSFTLGMDTDHHTNVIATFYKYESLARGRTSQAPSKPTISVETTTTSPPKLKREIPTTPIKPVIKVPYHMVVAGFVILPAKGIYTDLPVGSCLRVDIQEDIQCEQCDIPVLATVKISLSDISGNLIRYAVNGEGLKKGGHYTLSALVNVGWCSMKGGSEWLRPGDYFNDVSHTFSVPQDGVEVVKKDILVRGYQKYQCGEKQCYETENCTRDYRGEPYCRCPPFACGDMAEPDWVCGTDGKNYVSKCWMYSTDCFSGTIQLKHKGKCGNSGAFFSKEGNVVKVSVAVVLVFMMLIVLIVFFLRHRLRRTNVRRGTVSKHPIIFSSNIYADERPSTVVKDDQPIYGRVKDPVSVKIPAKDMTAGNKPKIRAENVYVITSDLIIPDVQYPATPPPPYDENERTKRMFGVLANE